MFSDYKIIIEKHSNGYVAYPMGGPGILVAHGDTHEEAKESVLQAMRDHVELYGTDSLILNED